ncbi:MAG: sulfotransferase, partial [Flavobacteriales bacterium]
MTKAKQIFIVGSSRSGTTMMGRILANHSDIFTFKELHFFGTIWTNNSESNLDEKQQI